jgi:SAM-dependent methyltransferase
LPFADERFDQAASLFGVIFLPEPEQGLRELRRVLRAGGRAVVSSWTPLGEIPFLRDAFGACFEAALGGPPPPIAPTWPTLDALGEALHGAGFRDVNVVEHIHPQHFATPDVAWTSMQHATAPLVLLRRGLGEAKWRVVDAFTRTRLRELWGERAVEIPLRANLGCGTR